MTQNKLVIIGGGAAGLMAAVAAGEAGIPCMLLERRHRPGLKLLLCGNNRCNISHNATADEMLEDYGGKIAEFLDTAIRAFSPKALCTWFQKAGLPTIVHGDRIYPKTEQSDDVLHCFLDRLRELQVPMALNCPVSDVKPLQEGGFSIICENGIEVTASNVLLATGGVSYPKTGSVGDGQRIAGMLGHNVTPLRAGLAGFEVDDDWIEHGHESDISEAAVKVFTNGNLAFSTHGNVLCSGNILRGKAIFDASRLIAHEQLADYSVTLDLLPSHSENSAREILSRSSSLTQALARIGIPSEIAVDLAKKLAGRKAIPEQVQALKNMPLNVTSIRPLKEAIVTVGGVSLDEICPNTMESKIRRGLYFAGELMDVDGPTGGYNLHAAFATARLAISSICGKAPAKREKPQTPPPKQSPKERYSRKGNFKSWYR